MSQRTVPATWMRGGTSKGLFLLASDLPSDPEERDSLLLRMIGSPDPYGKQIDGLGGATSSTSKVMLVGPTDRPDCDIEFRFGHVAIDKPVIDWSGSCGNLTTAVAPFAIEQGLVGTDGDSAIIRMWQCNISRRIDAIVPLVDGLPSAVGDCEIDGVAFPGSPIELRFLDPGGSDDASLFPTGHLVDRIVLHDDSTIQATLINAGNPGIFLHATDIGLDATESLQQLEKSGIGDRLEEIRCRASVMMQLAADEREAREQRPATPKIAIVNAAADYMVAGGKEVPEASIDLVSRIWSMGKPHHAYTGTGAIGLAVAAPIPGTRVADVLRAPRLCEGRVRFGHASGSMELGVTIKGEGVDSLVREVQVVRTARSLMRGEVLVPVGASVFHL